MLVYYMTYRLHYVVAYPSGCH